VQPISALQIQVVVVQLPGKYHVGIHITEPCILQGETVDSTAVKVRVEGFQGHMSSNTALECRS
jgi:hypothetical protein